MLAGLMSLWAIFLLCKYAKPKIQSLNKGKNYLKFKGKGYVSSNIDFKSY